MRAARARWRKAAEQKATIIASHALSSPTQLHLDVALRREPQHRTAEDLALLAAWLAGVQMAQHVRRTLDVDAMCRTMRCISPACAADEVVAAQADHAKAMFIVYLGEASAYSIADEEGVAYEGEVRDGISRDHVLHQVAKKRRREASARAAQAKTGTKPADGWRSVLKGLAAAPRQKAAARSQSSMQTSGRRSLPAKSPARPAAKAVSSALASAMVRAPAAAVDGASEAEPPRRQSIFCEANRRRYPGEGEKTTAATMVASKRRGQLTRRDMDEKRRAASRIQAGARGRKARVQIKRQHAAATKVQATARGRRVRHEISVKRSAATHVSAVHRGNVARREVSTLLENRSPGAAADAPYRRRLLAHKSRTLGRLACFGELSLVSDAARCDLCVVADVPTTLIRVDASAYRALRQQKEQQKVARRSALLMKLPAFGSFSHAEIADFAAALRSCHVAKGEAIPASQEPLLVESGEAVLTVRDPARKWAPPRQLAVLGVGSLYGAASKKHAPTPADDDDAPTVLRGAPCDILWLDRKLVGALGTACLEKVLSQVEATSERLRNGAERSARAYEAYGYAAIKAREAEATKPAWRGPPTRRTTTMDGPRAPPPPPPRTAGEPRRGVQDPANVPRYTHRQNTPHRPAPKPPGQGGGDDDAGGAGAAAGGGGGAAQVLRIHSPGLGSSASFGSFASFATVELDSSSGGGGFGGMLDVPFEVMNGPDGAEVEALAHARQSASPPLRQISTSGSPPRDRTSNEQPTGGGGARRVGKPLVEKGMKMSGEWERAATAGKHHGGKLLAQGASMLRELSVKADDADADASTAPNTPAHRPAPALPPRPMSAPQQNSRPSLAPSQPPTPAAHAVGHGLARPASAPQKRVVLSHSASVATCCGRAQAASSPSATGGGGGGGGAMGRSSSAATLVGRAGGSATNFLTSGGAGASSTATHRPAPSMSTGTLQLGAHNYHDGFKRIHRRAQVLLSLGMDLLEPLGDEGRDSVRVAKPRSEHADLEQLRERQARPRDALAREEPWGKLWVTREERVSSSMRRHVIMTRANSGMAESKATIAAKRKLNSRLR